MKNIFTILSAIILTASVFAQSPEKMSYQAIIRDAANILVANQAVGMQISILQGSASGSAVYVETQTSTTNTNGLVSIEIGGGTAVSGTFSAIDWTNGPYFIKTETDPAGGTNYTITGTSQLLSVPYALYAKTAESVTESDPVFIASAANVITSTNITNWNTAYGWGNHAGLYRPISYVPAWSDITSNPFSITSPSNNQILKYNNTSSKWENWTPNYLTAEVDGSVTNEIELPSQTGNSGRYLTTNGTSPSWTAISTGASQLSELSDVSSSTATSGNVLVANGSSFQSVSISGDASLASNGTLTIADNSVDGTDIALGGDTRGDIMYYDGTNWVRLAAGASGQVLQTNGAGANPSWVNSSGGSSSPTITQISSNTTLSTDDQVVIITGAITVTLPASPREAQRLELITNNANAVIHLNGGTINQSGNDYTTNDPFNIYGSPGLYVQIIYHGTKWYVMFAR